MFHNFHWFSSWWFLPIWKILVKLDHFPNFRGENKTYLKPPTSFGVQKKPRQCDFLMIRGRKTRASPEPGPKNPVVIQFRDLHVARKDGDFSTAECVDFLKETKRSVNEWCKHPLEIPGRWTAGSPENYSNPLEKEQIIWTKASFFREPSC